MTYTLVAMPASGETFVVRSDLPGLWLIPPVGPTEQVSADFVDQAVVKGGWDRIGRDYENWVDLNADRQKIVAEMRAALRPECLYCLRDDCTDHAGCGAALDEPEETK